MFFDGTKLVVGVLHEHNVREEDEEECYECDYCEDQEDAINEYYYGYEASIKRVAIRKRSTLGL